MKSVRSTTARGIIPCLLLLMLAFCSCVSSPEAKSARFLEAGKRLLKNKDAPRAILQFQNAIQATPKNPEPYYQLGLAYLAAGDLRNGVAGLRRVIELDPNYSAAQLRLAQLMTGASDPAVLRDAQQRLQAMLHGASNNPDALHALALTELKLGDTAEAMRHLDMAIAAAPRELTIAITLAQAKLQQKDAKGAETALIKVSEISPKSVDAAVILGLFYLSQNKAVEAEQQFQRALGLDPHDSGALLNLATLQDQMGRKQEAEQSFRRLSGTPAFDYVYGVFLLEAGRKDEAVREFERLAKENPDDRLARTRLVAVYRDVKRVADADRILNQALKKNGKDLDALLQRAEMSLAAGKYDQAEVDLNHVLDLRPASAEVQYILAKLHRARGSELRYRQELAKTLELSPFLLPVRLEFARSLLASNNSQAALDALNEAPEAQKQSTSFTVERNWVLWSLGNMPELRQGIDRGLARARSADLLIQDGLWKLRAGDPRGARVAIEAALKIDPADLRALQALSQTYLAQKNASMAVQKVKEYAASNPTSAPIQDFLGLLLMAQGDTKQAQVAFAAAKTADPGFVQADLSLVQMDFVQGKLGEAKKRLEAVLATNESNPTARLWLGIMEEKLGDRNAAIDLYRKVAQGNPDSAQASNNLAYLLVEYGNQPDEALKYAERAVQLAPEDPAYSDTLGWILYRKGVYASAVPYLERASAHQARDSVIWKYHLAMAYVKAGEIDRGRATLAAALQLNPNLPEAKIALQVVQAAH